MSQLVSRLRNELSAATTPNDRAELLSRLAGALARQGKFAEASQCVSEARQLLADSGAIGTVWVMLAEGLINLFEHQGPLARDRIHRALLLGTALRQPRIIAYAAAWKAHMEFEASQFEEMIASLGTAQASAAEDDLDAQTRLSMVLQKAFAICGSRDQAHVWFSRAHRSAVRNGDQASIDGVQYNKVALELVRLRVQNCAEELRPEAVRHLRKELESSMSLTSLTRVSTLHNHLRLVDARCYLLEQQYEIAKEKLQAVRQQSPFASNHFSQEYAELEICFCSFRLGQSDQVDIYLDASHSVDFSDLDRDDQIVAVWMQSQMAPSHARFGEVGSLQQQLRQLQDLYLSETARLLAALQPFA